MVAGDVESRVEQAGGEPDRSLTHHRTLLLASCFLPLALLSQTLTAQERHIELSPLFSYQFGASYELNNFEEIDVEDSSGYGLSLGIPISRHLQVELLYLHQSTDVELDDGFFPPIDLGDTDIDTYQIGVLWQGASGQVKPFISVAAGVSELDIALDDISDETSFSLSIAGGVKLFFTEHLGVRFDGRLLIIDLGDDRSHHDDCCHDESDSFAQVIVSAGLIFAF